MFYLAVIGFAFLRKFLARKRFQKRVEKIAPPAVISASPAPIATNPEVKKVNPKKIFTYD